MTTTSITTTATSITVGFAFTDLLGGKVEQKQSFRVGKLGIGTELHIIDNSTAACRNRSRRAHSMGWNLDAVTCLDCKAHLDALLAEQATFGG